MKNYFIVMIFVSFLFCGCLFTEPQESRSTPRIPSGTTGTTEPAVPPIYYSQFGAKGDGKTDDFDAIKRTHDAANISGATVKGDAGKTYYIGATTQTISIQTDTDWGNSKFIFDDTTIEKRGRAWAHSWIFTVESAQKPFPVYSVSALKKGQPKLPLNLGQKLLFVAIDNTTRRYRRSGENENPGSFQTDVFIVDEDGVVDPNAPILWDFNNITSLTAYPIDEHQLKITGGRITTIASRGSDRDPYMYRGIYINRSNVLVDGFYHDIEGGEELPITAYNGFLNFNTCANVTLQNSTLTGHLPMNGLGTYDLMVSHTVNFSAINCDQTNTITGRYWGIFASGYSKNIVFDTVSFSRFDAHQGVHNVTILNSQIGWQGLLAIGSGTLRVENTSVQSTRFIALRGDYGSTWEGDVYVKNCTHIGSGSVLDIEHRDTWDYGYPCYLPANIYIDGYTASATDGLMYFRLGATANPPYPYANLNEPKHAYIRNAILDTTSAVGRGYIIQNDALWDWPLED